ncbi:uncharacterized protein [Primulina eburnea]|uniref:uncharacterized protein n=1 Tax=Primulina eburnea TaxID=1245227 RepID=UPI003C6C6610
MESPTPVSRYVHGNSKKRVFPGGSSSSVCKDVDVLEIGPPSNHTPKPKSSRKNEVICHEIIDVDVEEDRGDVMIIDPHVGVHGKGKEALPAFSICLGGLAADGLASDIKSTNGALQSPDSMIIDDSSSNNFFGEEDWLDNYYDDILFDEHSMLESHFDHMDIPPGIEAPFPWLPSSPRNKNKVTTTGTSTNSSLQLKSDVAIVPSSLNSPLTSWPSPSRSKSTRQPKKLKLPYKSLEPGAVPNKSTVSISTSFLGSQSSISSLALKHGKEPLHSFGKNKRNTRASQVIYSGPLGQLSSGASYPPVIVNHASSSLKLKMPSSSPGMETYMPPWQDLRLNMLGPSIGPSGFLTEFVTWPQDSTDFKNGESPMVIQTTNVEPRNIDEVLQNFEGFKKFDTVEDYSDHFYLKNASSGKQPPKNWAKRIQEEWKILEKDLPDTIFVRVYEARMDLLRAVIVGAEGTPYHDGLFFFDVFFPSSYPNVPPLVHYHSGGLRINPNLYNCGKVCLSLLNTWSGNHKEKWILGVSTMLQVLVSIQGLTLNAKPYFNEPGFANTSGSPTGEKRSLDYNESTFIYSLQTMVYSMKRPPKHFENFVIGHYCKYARDIMVSCKAYLDGAQVGCLVKGGVQDVDEGDKSCSQHFKNSLAGFIPTLVNTFSQIGAKDCQEFLSLSQKATGPAIATHRSLQLMPSDYYIIFLFLISGFMLAVAMNPSLNMPFSSCFYKSLCFFLISNLFVSSVLSSPSYTDHCSSVVPESRPTQQTYRIRLPRFRTTYYTGGERLIGEKPLNKSYDYVGKSLFIKVTSDSYETIAKNVYTIRGQLVIRSPYRYYNRYISNFSNDGSYYNRRRRYRSNVITFFLNGFWSESSRKLCMVGSASWKSINLDAVLKLSYNSLNPSMLTSVISGTLESTSSVKDSGYFEPISMFDFPSVPDYIYSLVSKELGGGYSGGFEGPKDQSLDLDSSRFCSSLLQGFNLFELELGRECDNAQTCSARAVVDGFLPQLVSLYPIQCYEEKRVIRYVVRFQNVSYTAFNENFDLNATLIGEGAWDDKKNQLLIVACRILDPVNHFGNGIGDCSLRLSFRYPSILTIRNHAKIAGKIWTNKTIYDAGYFRNINLTSIDGGYVAGSFSGLRYEYTELDKAKRLCRVEKVEKKKGNIYPDAQSYNMRFDMSVENSNGKKFAWGYTVPLSIGNEVYQGDMGIALAPESAPVEDAVLEPISEPQKIRSGPLNMSFILSITPFYSEINNSRSQSQIQITAEGVYDLETGWLCMVGCRKFPSNVKKSDDNSIDCEIVVNFQFAPINNNNGGLISGIIRSTRKKTDPLYFEDMTMSSAAFYSTVAERSIWRMDLEITMVLISNTFLCILVGLQLFHVRRNPEVVSSISLVMLLILSLGYMIPLVLNFEALFFQNYNKQPFMLSSKGWLEANEVTLRIVIMVAFLLQIRLLQLVWTAKTSEGNEKGLWGAEKKAVFVSVPMYFFGGLLTLLLNWIKSKNHEMHSYVEYDQVYYSLWGYLRSYAGLILDGFLLPQILLNTFSGSSAKALSNPFYIGTSAVRLVPHAYDQYRAHNFPRTIVNGTYYYANPSADFYSTSWDVIIPCGVVALAVIVFLQQRHGGRWILPRRFRELELYEKVPSG